MPSIRPARALDTKDIAALHARCFGPGRYARTAYRLREQSTSEPTASLVMEKDERIIASVRLSKIRIGGKPGALLLGPLAVSPEATGSGFGTKLMEAAIAASKQQGYELIILVGDIPFYGQFDFTTNPDQKIRLPGPVDYSRLLVRELKPDAKKSFEGLVTPD